MIRIFKYCLFGLLFVLFFGVQQYLPAIENVVKSLQVKALGGSRFSDQRPNFWPWAWKDGSYQKQMQGYLKNESPVSANFVRLHSQLDFSLFGEIPHEDILMGKDNYLLPKSSWEAAAGKDFLGVLKIEEYAHQLAVINDYLKARGKRMLLLVPPNKSSTMWDYLPDYYRNYPQRENNFNGFREAFEKEKLDHISFEHFLESWESLEYPLFPQGGLHWTYFGYSLAADSIRNYISEQFHWDIPTMDWRDSIELKEKGLYSDTELYSSANLLFQPKLKALPYPKISYRRDSAEIIKVFSIGDSYYKLLYNYGIHQGLFHQDSPFWYYASTLYPPVYRKGKKLNNSGDLEVLEIIENCDLVILTVIEGNLKNFGWGWVKRTYNAIRKKEKLSNEVQNPQDALHSN